MISVLHLEDNPLDAELVYVTLETAGFEVSVTRVDTEKTYSDALDNSHFDLILADYSLPSFDGLSALRLLRTLKRDTPFVLLSGALGEELAIESLKQGATDYVLKHRLERLGPAIDRALRESAERTELRRAEMERERLVGELAVAYEREHRIAETLQRSFLNKLDPGRFPGVEMATIYQAAWEEAQVGGDYFDHFPLRNGRVAIVVGDVSGKGLIAAERTAELKYTLRAYLHEHDEPTLAVSRLNDFLCEGSNLDPTDFDYFVVLSLAVVDPTARTATVVIAGAEPVLLIHATGGADEIKSSGLPLGILAGAAYSSAVAAIVDTDVILMSTDGLTEARQGKELLGQQGLASIAVDAIRSSSLNEMGEAILARAQAYSGGKLHDDTCLILARLRDHVSA